MRHITYAVLLVVGLVLAPNAASAQALGTIAGSVKDTSGAVLPGVTVEASSPALIEKVRSVTTDGSGLYRIVNLPPGSYSITFSLPGFNQVRREMVDVTIGFTLSIDAELRVGSLEETVTVTGESPVVDVQSAALTRSITSETFKEIPSSGSWIQMAALVPAIRASVQDVGGVLGDQTGAEISAHGSRNGDGVSMIDGMRIGNMYLSSNLTNMSLSPLLSEQVDVQLSGQMADTGTNGVIMNLVPKSGGNTFNGTLLANGSHPNLQGGNVTDDLQDRGLAGASTTLKTLYDLNAGVGGPIKKDRLWFYATSRYFTNEYYLANRFFPVDVNSRFRQNDTGQQAYAGTYTYDNNGRVTWQITDKQKFSSWYAYQYKQDPHWLINVFVASPEAARVTRWNTQLSTSKWSYTPTSRLLFEAGLMAGQSPDTIKTDLDRIGGIAIVDQSTGLNYRAPTAFDWDDRLPSQSFTGSMSYVTGSHNAKVGMELQRGYFQRNDNNDSTGGIWYTVNNTTTATPLQVTIQAPAEGWQSNLNYNLGIYAQDRWTLNKLTVNAGVRLDFLNESTEEFTLGPHRWLPNRNQHFDAIENVPNWKDINPRVSVAYDLFGNGKTALKGSASRGVEQDSIRYAQANNPGNALATQTARNWTDSNNNFTPDCDLLNPAAQDLSASGGDICGGWATPGFGNPVPATRYDPAIMNGWGERPWNWEFSAGVQHELMPRVSTSVGYFRRINGNFHVTDNLSLTAADFTTFSVVAPTLAQPPAAVIYPGVPALPNAGQTITGFYDQNILPVASNMVKNAKDFGKQQGHWDGVDFSVDARLQGGLFLQGGLSTGQTMTDNCDVIDDLPEILNVAGVQQSASYCHFESGFLTQYKALASYTLPYGVRISGTYQSIPGPQIAANTVYRNPDAAGAVPLGTYSRTAMTNMSRPFTVLGQSNVNLVVPGTEYGDRLNQFDLRFTKIVGFGRGRLDLNVDVYNAFNSDAALTQQNNYASWYRPLSVIQPRFVKFSARWDF
jgi:hypothetical protein